MYFLQVMSLSMQVMSEVLLTVARPKPGFSNKKLFFHSNPLASSRSQMSEM